jgi:hypothetical protein
MLRDGLIPLAGVVFYLVTFVMAWITPRCPGLAWAALAFFILCLANMIAIEAWELRETSHRALALHPCTHWLVNTHLFWVPLAVMVCAIAGRNEWYASIALSAGACAVLFWLGRRLSLEARRALVDGVLLSPLLFLLLK